MQGNDLLDKIRSECWASPSARAECAAKVFHSLLKFNSRSPKIPVTTRSSKLALTFPASKVGAIVERELQQAVSSMQF
jgi:hypothetical protein